ncbi:hypothetical protein GCM10009647_083750 [Streptomyces sanglieri]|uniref:hypothetical protein n=1 Tax=Streptomyces sp. Wh19 TaxID=3076629 RepID=UPI002958545E|nr:hypothetical protein [Streptomyces sp. Wh19]MDV9198450.1 hypothetical protein [Streptomyces sp. Wh19]
MGRFGSIDRPILPPGARRDLNLELHNLHCRAGRISTREIAERDGRFDPSTVHNAFSKAKVPSYQRIPIWSRSVRRCSVSLWARLRVLSSHVPNLTNTTVPVPG